MRKVVDRDWVILRMSGHLEAEHLAEIRSTLAEEGMNENVVLDLSEVTVIAQEAVRFLAHFEVNRIDLHKCPAYIRDWIAQERRAMKRRDRSDPTIKQTERHNKSDYCRLRDDGRRRKL